jgi:hypothetical protein
MDEFSNSGRSLEIQIAPAPAFTRRDKDRAYPTARFKPEASTGRFDEAWESVFSRSPANTLRDFVPSEDVRLADADGYTFAVLGLSVAGGPTVAFIDDAERL